MVELASSCDCGMRIGHFPELFPAVFPQPSIGLPALSATDVAVVSNCSSQGVGGETLRGGRAWGEVRDSV